MGVNGGQCGSTGAHVGQNGSMGVNRGEVNGGQFMSTREKLEAFSHHSLKVWFSPYTRCLNTLSPKYFSPSPNPAWAIILLYLL